MDTPPSSIIIDELEPPTLRHLANLFDVPAWASSSEVDPETVSLLSPLVREEIPDGYHRWVEKRQREYRAGRHHARAALIDAGMDAPLVRRGDDGLPLFPSGYNGSITHTGRQQTFAAAAVCGTTHMIGLDAENHKRLSAEMVDAILLPHEQRRFFESTSCAPQGPKEIGDFGLWVFSMKEAFYKCVYQRCAAPFGFLDLDVEVDPERKQFLVMTRTDKYPDVPKQLVGRYQLDRKRIVCGVTWKL